MNDGHCPVSKSFNKQMRSQSDIAGNSVGTAVMSKTSVLWLEMDRSRRGTDLRSIRLNSLQSSALTRQEKYKKNTEFRGKVKRLDERSGSGFGEL